MNTKRLTILLLVFAIGCEMEQDVKFAKEKNEEQLPAFFAKKFDDQSVTLANKSKVNEGSVEEIGGLTGKNRISHDESGTLLKFSAMKTVDHQEFKYQCLFTVVPHCSYTDDLTLAEVMNGRELTQYYLWRVNEATGEQKDIAVKRCERITGKGRK